MNKKVYRIIINQPGYLPESEPYDVDTLQDAKSAIADEIATAREDGYGYRAYNGYSKIRKADMEKHEELLIGYLTRDGNEEYAISLAYVDESL